nr:hypothetical protein [Dendronalium sp. ChiSLP03b]MDZ8206588.1 hypothetical protein [Dendronalium sp. ChiSLP03b]
MFSEPGEAVIFPWLPSKDMIQIAHQQNRQVFAGDPLSVRCFEAIAHSLFKFEPLGYP